jgi:SEC-C motif domain protein
MSVLLYDPAKNNHVLLLKESAWSGRRWAVNLFACDNPCCGCLCVNFDCIPDDGENDFGTASMKFALDTEQRSVYRDGKRKGHMPADEFADAVAKELGDEGWDYLQKHLLSIKKEQIENCDPERLDAKFPPEVLRGEGTMVSYGEIFPLASALSFSIASEQWFVLDDYCVNPDCRCSEVLLQFVRGEYVCGNSPAEMEKAPPAVFYDYQKRTFKQAQAPESNQPSLQSLLSALKEQTPDLGAQVKKKHLTMKTLYKRALSKFEETEFEPSFQMDQTPLHTPKPGRNDPCPCGSGKKYKKCCGS